MNSDIRFALPEQFQNAANAFAQALIQPLNPELQKFFEQENATQGQDAYFAQTAAGASPQVASFTGIFARNPYSNPEIIETNIQEAAQRGWIDLAEKGFTATSKAQAFSDKLIQLLMDHANAREATLDMDLAHLVARLETLVESAQTVQAITDKPNFTFARNFEYEDKTPSLVWVRRHLITLGAYRDDSHIAAWKPYQLPGYVWESLTFVWQDQAHTAAELAEKLAFRGYTEENYAQALAQLAERGWLEAQDGHYSLTGEGLKQRQLAEDKTNQYYQAAFESFPQAALEEVISMLQTITEEITIEEDTQPA